MGFQIPTVTKEHARGYARDAWHMGGGIKPILDETTLQFASDFANVCLKSVMQDMAEKIRAIKAIKEAQQVGAQRTGESAPVPTNAVQPLPQMTATPGSRIILTD